MDSKILQESAHIGEELIAESSLSAIERKCLVVKQTVLDGDFTLEEALSLYEVSEQDFEHFIVKDLTAEIMLYLSMLAAPNKLAKTAGIDLIRVVFNFLFDKDKAAAPVIKQFEDFSKKIAEETVLV